MKPKTLILMVVAVVCGLGASYMTSRLLAEREEKAPEPVEIPKVKLLVAKKNLDMHTAVRNKPEDLFEAKEFVKDDNTPKEVLGAADLSKLKGKFLKRSLRKGDYVRQDDILDSGGGIGTLPPGMRAVGIPVSPQQSAAGWTCVPGSHIDIIWTRKVGGEEDTVAKVLLKDVIVLAADTAANPREEGGAMPANVVVVALNPDDTNDLTLAMQTGSLTLVLRNFDDRGAQAGADAEPSSLKRLIQGRDKKQPDPPQIAKDQNPAADPSRDPFDRPKVDNPPKNEDHKPQKKPLPVLKKETIVVRQGKEVELRHYWTDEQGNIVANPQQYLQQFEDQQDQLPPPADDNKGKKAAGDI
jgi:Flp pilus assembly protein CpaB